MKSAQPTASARLKSLQDRRLAIVRQFERIQRAINGAQQQLAHLAPRLATLTQPERAAA